ncbi:MAG: hypothetical protein KDE15_04260 [Erythrobacter sp.]|nr:hypothetical protein [Erythrobacter sp.]
MRIDGWKSIAAHFGRERSTVIRWASERGMPVYRIPGPGRGSVYALSDELDTWLEADRAANGDLPDPASAAPGPAPAPSPAPSTAPDAAPPTPAAPAPRRWHKGWLALPAALALASLGAWAVNQPEPAVEQQVLPQDAALADLYLQARSDWAERSPASIEAAIGKLQQVVAGDPGFAPAYAALADCFVLAREFGSLGDADAFGRAQIAADTALRIDPDNADALRAAGFIDYWWREDRPAAARRFTQAIAANPQSAQSHFWFGNVLIDNGDFARGMAELERARLLEPASLPIQTDIAWARWSRGEVERAVTDLEALRDRQPQLATVRDYLSIAYLEQGNIPGFVSEIAALAEIRNMPEDLAVARALEAALASDPASVVPVMLHEQEAMLASGARSYLPWPAMVASAAGDRAAVLRLLATATQRGERWGSAGMMRYIGETWSGDSEITGQLNSLRGEPLIVD